MQIPRRLHIIWIGHENPRPDACVASWRRKHPDWELRVWDERDLFGQRWINEKHMDTFWRHRKWAGVADLMRYEILYRHGGVYVDADSACVRRLDDWLLESEMFACWLNEFEGRRLIANGFLGSIVENEFLRFVIYSAAAKTDVLRRWSWSRMRMIPMGAWRSVGPFHLTQCLTESGYDRITILPSHMFLPRHYRGKVYSGGGVVYADHFWGTTLKTYDSLRSEAQPPPASAAARLREAS
jgi:mannosyltransferase OCH1-like enzyme